MVLSRYLYLYTDLMFVDRWDQFLCIREILFLYSHWEKKYEIYKVKSHRVI